MGIDRPSPDHEHAKVIYLISAHLESGHYFNPHAQRITQARENGAKVIVLDTRLSNTATHADHWLSPQPGSEAAINLALANHLIQAKAYDREFVRRWWNWAEYLTACHPGVPVTFEAFEEILAGLYAEFTFGFAAAESGIDEAVLAEVAGVVAGAGTRFSCHSWRSAATIAEQLLPGWLVSLQADARHRGQPAPEIVLTAANSDTVTRLVRAGQADLGFVEGPASPKGLHSRVIGHDELVVIVRPDHPWARRGQPLEPGELAAARIVSREEGSGTRDVLTAALSAALGARVTTPVALALSTTVAVRSAVLAGAGPAVLSELTVAEDIGSRRLARVPVAGVNLRRSLRAIWAGGSLPPAGAARDLLAHVTAGGAATRAGRGR